MSAELLFSAATTSMAACWLLLAAGLYSSRLQSAGRWLAGTGLPVLLGGLYVGLLIPRLPFEAGGFDSLAAVRQLFEDDGLLLAGWLHYLLFDFFVGGWIVVDATTRRVPGVLVMPCLAATFLAGPVGLLLYLLVRAAVLLRWKPSA